MCRRPLAVVLLVLLFIQYTLPKDYYLFPAAQVLWFLTGVKWKSEQTFSQLDSVGRKVWEECLALGEEWSRGYSDHLIAFLRGTSEGTVKEQLEAIVEKVLEKDNVTLPGTEDLLKNFLSYLKNSRSDLYKELKKVHPLIYN